MLIQLLVFEGCPMAEPARENLKEALTTCGIDTFEEIDILDSKSPEELRGWGSPTILVNGQDISGHKKGGGVSCRIYNMPGGVPDVQSIVNSLRNNAQ
ncbi:MAG: hypothetical protein KTR32_28235 [Granulosicoccus sp.]|nr:hypothetical protein [Granulosicoccus sp.]